MFSTFLQQLKIMPNLILTTGELYFFQIFSCEIYFEKKTRFHQRHNDDGASKFEQPFGHSIHFNNFYMMPMRSAMHSVM